MNIFSHTVNCIIAQAIIFKTQFFSFIKYSSSRVAHPIIFESLAPIIAGAVILALWQLGVEVTNAPHYILPGPFLVIQTLIRDWNELFPSLMITFRITLIALIAAIISGVTVSILLIQNKWIEKSLLPYAVILQTTPIAAIAPLIILWTRNNTFVALIICAWIVAFFPILSSTTLGLRSTDRHLLDLMYLYRASRWQILVNVRLPNSMPYFLGGLRISGGLALIGAVVAEFVTGTGGTQSGIAYQILIAGYNLQVPRMFAALLMTTGLGVIIFITLSLISDFVLRKWHESVIDDEK